MYLVIKIDTDETEDPQGLLEYIANGSHAVRVNVDGMALDGEVKQVSKNYPS